MVAAISAGRSPAINVSFVPCKDLPLNNFISFTLKFKFLYSEMLQRLITFSGRSTIDPWSNLSILSIINIDSRLTSYKIPQRPKQLRRFGPIILSGPSAISIAFFTSLASFKRWWIWSKLLDSFYVLGCDPLVGLTSEFTHGNFALLFAGLACPLSACLSSHPEISNSTWTIYLFIYKCRP